MLNNSPLEGDRYEKKCEILFDRCFGFSGCVYSRGGRNVLCRPVSSAGALANATMVRTWNCISRCSANNRANIGTAYRSINIYA
jgi:hypothetical protein